MRNTASRKAVPQAGDEIDTRTPTAAAAKSTTHHRTALANPFEVLNARAVARARLWADADIPDLQTAVDELQFFAVRSGLINSIGQDAVQDVIADAFRPIRVAAGC